MEILQSYKAEFEKYLVANAFKGEPRELYKPANYIMLLGGKRLRPAIAMMGYELYEDNMAPVMPVALAVETFHNFSLVHDDIMDEALVRRGKPSVHSAYGVNTAILSGDVMLVLAYDMLTQVSNPTIIPDLLKVFSEFAREVCEGQQMDINFETQDNVKIEQYIKMIELKTAALFAGALQMGAIVGNAPAEDVDNLRTFGRNIGIAFQLQDDILDTFGDPEKFGKRIGGDIIQNKKTFLILKALELAAPEQASRLNELMSLRPKDEQAKIEEVTQLLRDLDIPKYAEAEKESYKQVAFSALDQVNVDSYKKLNLMNLSEIIVGRNL